LNEKAYKEIGFLSTPHPHNAGFLALVEDAKSRIRQTDVEGYRKIAPDPHVLVDVREDHEWAAGHAAGAVHMSKGTIERDIETKVPDKSTTMVLYCGGGYRSALAADALQKMGYSSVISLDGGWRAWNAAGLPVEKP
jgi:rhodanese-related sulfurtransferase